MTPRILCEAQVAGFTESAFNGSRDNSTYSPSTPSVSPGGAVEGPWRTTPKPTICFRSHLPGSPLSTRCGGAGVLLSTKRCRPGRLGGGGGLDDRLPESPLGAYKNVYVRDGGKPGSVVGAISGSRGSGLRQAVLQLEFPREIGLRNPTIVKAATRATIAIVRPASLCYRLARGRSDS